MTNNVHLLKILLNNLLFFLFPKFLELFFTPKNTPPKFWNSKLGLMDIFFGTPCILILSDARKQYVAKYQRLKKVS